MAQVTPDEAKAHLPDLIAAALRGETVVIRQDDEHAVRLVPVTQAPARPHRKAGSAKGTVVMSDDFDAPLADFEEYMR
ncbi:MAG TPA: DUF2281 domain-containing protein [Ktedonobacterales bacterium]|nr:DUF2281 domain-containing protein [Ktedonobacterales bacterium]